MRITFLGHASLLIETPDVRVLVDPVFGDLHGENLFEIFPPRVLCRDRLPPFEILFVSHHHQDHFDVATLAGLPRDVQVIIPADELMRETFAALGYQAVTCIGDFSEFKVGATRFMFTPSSVPFVENGLLVSSPDGTFWNQVDTILTLPQIDLVLAQNPPVDLLVAPWQPMLEQAWQNNQPLGFPFAEYAAFLQNVGRVCPRALVPGANGFCYTDRAAWLNHVVFPQTRDRFLADAEKIMPALHGRTFTADAGDVLEINKGGVTKHSQACDFVSAKEYDAAALEFRPATAARPFCDETDKAESHRASVTRFAAEILPAYINQNPTLFRNHRDWEVIFQLEIAFADEPLLWWYDFAAESVVANIGRTPLANLRCGITATGLGELLAGECSWDKVSLGGDFYQQQSVYGVWRNGLIVPQQVSMTNPLFVLLPYESSFNQVIRRQFESR
jgi:UDP-MurNAc hydroxylase